MGVKIIEIKKHKDKQNTSTKSILPCFQTAKEEEDFFCKLRSKARKGMGYNWK